MPGAALGALALLLLVGCTDDETSSGPHAAPESSDESIANGEPGDKASEDPEASVRSIEIDTGDFTFEALEAGPEDGELVMLLHGFPQTADQWRSQMAALSAAGYHVVAPNQRGYSPGARPNAVEDYALDRLVEDVIAMADALGAERFHVVGHDWGGAVTWAVADQHPDRLGSVTVVSTPHPNAMAAAFADPESDQATRSSYVAEFAAEGSEERFLADDAAFLRAFYEDAGLSAQEMERQLEVLLQPGAMRAALNWYSAAVQVPQSPTGPSTVPTMYVWSDGDTALGPQAAAATADQVTGPYRFEVLEGVNHWIPEVAADDLNVLLLDFLAGQDPL